MLVPKTTDSYAAAGLTSPSGTAHVFDTRADGFVRGESCGAGVLSVGMGGAKTTGSAVRQDGRSASLTAPSGQAQQLLLHSVLNDANIEPIQLHQYEAAANGSPLGDAVEASALAAALLTTPGEELLVGSIKANVGHTESASGMVGIVKLLSTCLRREQAAPNAQLLSLAAPVTMAVQHTTRACVFPTQLSHKPHSDGTASSFGLGGTIASVALHATACTDRDGGTKVPCLIYRRCNFLWQPPLRVHLAQRGAISDLELCEQPAFTSLLAAGEVEIQIRAVGLNFRDVLIVLDEYPGDLADPGGDCAGTVTSVGEHIPHTRLGHQLFGIANGCLSTFVRARADARLLVHRPSCTTTEEACTLPATWSTVHEVVRRGSLHGSERQLLHAAVGGVGLVATAYLRWLRAGVIATAGHAGKHTILRSLDVLVSCSSRQGEAFAIGLSTQLVSTRLRGVCNSLSNDFIGVSLAGNQ